MDALILCTDEGRAKLRYARVSCKEALTPRFPNGETDLSGAQVPATEILTILGCEEGTRRTETSK